MSKNILVFAGSTRAGAFSGQFAGAGARAVEAAGGVANFINLADYPVAIFNQDDEANDGMPETMRQFKAAVAACDGMLIATPEYNGCVPPLLVNVFSWASRNEVDDAYPAVFAQKPVAVMASSPGGMGGVRVVPRLRDMLCELGCVPVNGFATLPQAHSAFDEEGNLVSEQTQSTVDGLVSRLLEVAN